MTDHDKEAIEAMAEAAYWHDNPYGSGNGIPLHRYRMEAALAADPLRQRLGTEAVKALMDGKAVVVPARNFNEGCWFAPAPFLVPVPESVETDVAIDGYLCTVIRCKRLDKPKEEL